MDSDDISIPNRCELQLREFAQDPLLDVCITVCVAGRNLEKMHKRYESWKDNNLKIFKYDVLKAIIFDYEVDYVIHAAGNAHPLAFNSDPVGTIIGNIEGTYNLLEYGGH